MNDSGQVTGWTTTCSWPSYCPASGFLYRGGQFTTLDVPGADVTTPTSINVSGQVVGVFSDERGTHGFIATPPVVILDNFNRDDGRLGPDWKGKAGVSAYRIVDQQISVVTGGPVYWQPNPFGLDQEAFVTLTRVDPQGAEQGLLLKTRAIPGTTGRAPSRCNTTRADR